MFFRVYSFIKYRISLYWGQQMAIAQLKRSKCIPPATTSFRGKCRIRIKGRITLGECFICNSGPLFSFGNQYSSVIEVMENGTLTIGNQVGISNTTISCNNSITIGDYVNIGAGCIIMDSNYHSTDWRIRENRSLDVQSAKTAPIIIEDHVFIGANCIICKGINIGARSIIAAGSVVVKDIPQDCIAGGNPATVIKYLVDLKNSPVI